MTPQITPATAADRDPIVASLVAAFVQDPLLRLLFPDDADYPRLAAVFFGHLFDKRVSLGTVWTLGGGASSALWEPPAGSDPAAPDELAAHLPPSALAHMRSYDEAVHAALPSEPYWYLGVLGTHPEHAGHGWGRALMRDGLERAAAEGLPVYGETSNPGNVTMYERAGWRIVTEIPAPLPTWVISHRSENLHPART